MLKPFIITYNGLKSAINLAHKLFINNTWTQSNCEAYLKVEGIHAAAIKKCIEHSTAAFSLLVAERESEPDHQLMEALLSQRLTDPAKFECAAYPAAWMKDGMELTLHLDAVMHLLFLGVVNSVITRITDWLTVLNKNASFIRENAPILNSFKNLSIDWMVIQPFTKGKLGSWVSENYLGFSRIMSWFYQNIDQAEVVNENVPPIGLPQQKWLVKHNKYWLDRHAMPSDGLAAQLSLRVANAMKMDPIPDEIIEPDRHPDDVQYVLISLNNMLQCLMSSNMNDETVNQANYVIRIFLSKFDHLDKTIITGKTKPTIISSYNFLCLLNLPKTMDTYGPLRDLWEGGFKGEGFLRFMKPLINQGFRTNWQSNCLKKLLRIKAFDNILSKRQFDSHEYPKYYPPMNKASFHKYGSQQEVLDLLSETRISRKSPISVILVVNENKHGQIFCCVEDYHHVIQVKQVTSSPGIEKFGLVYYKLDLVHNGSVIRWSDVFRGKLKSQIKIGYAMLLPFLGNDQMEEKILFALVSSNWKSLSKNNTIVHLVE